MTWVRTPLDGFTVGDRIRFTCEMRDERVEGVVANGDRAGELGVRRDDGMPGGGDDGTWLVAAAVNGRLYKWVEDVVEGHWGTEIIEARDLAVGDRVKRHGGRYHGFEGVVIHRGPFTNLIGNYVNTDYIHIRRDDGETGNGVGNAWTCALSETFCRWVDGAAPEQTPEQPAEGPMRAVFCECCGYATGEFTATTATERYCRQCRALPQLWRHGGTPQPGLLNTGERGTHVEVGRHARMRNIGAIAGVPPAPYADTLATALVDPFDEEDDEEQEEYGIPCTECGGHEFRVHGIEFRAGTLGTYYRNTEDHYPNETVCFELDYEDIDLDIIHGTGHVVCDNCGQRQHDMNWEL